MVSPARVERATFGSANQRSIHLSYGLTKVFARVS